VKSAGTIRFAALAAIALVWVSITIRVGASRAADSATALSPADTSCTLNSTDSALNTGKPATNDYSATGSAQATIIAPAGSHNQLWFYDPNPYGITSGSGTIDMDYSGSGPFGWSTNLSGLDNEVVVAYPNIQYGRSLFSGTGVDGQPPQFPAELSTVNSMPIDVAYTLTDKETDPHNLDVLFDEWVTTAPDTLYTNIGDWLEVGVFPYFAFPAGYAGTLVKTFDEAVTLNGTPTTISFHEYSAASGTCVNSQCGQAVFFYAVPDQNVASGEIAFDMLDFLKEAISTSGISGLNYLQAHDIGTELGGGTTANFSFTMSKFGFQLIPQVCPAPPPASISVAPTTLSFPVTGIGSRPTTKSFTIRNLSKTNMLIGQIVVPAGPFSSTPNGPLSVKPHGSSKVEVNFAPTDAMSHSLQLQIDSNDPAHPTVNVTLNGTGEAGVLSAPASIKFPATRVGSTSSRHSILGNRGKGTLTGTIPTLGASYSISPIGPFTIQAGKTLPIAISFMPQTTGTSDSGVNIAVDSPSTPQPGVTIRLSGSGK